MSDLDKINSIFNAKIDSVKTKEDLQNIKTEFLEKRTNNTAIQNFRFSRNLTREKILLQILNKVKDDLSIQIEQKILR